MGRQDDTMRRVTLPVDIPIVQPVTVTIPEAPGFFLADSLDDAAKRRYARTYDVLESALCLVIDSLPMPDDVRGEMTVERDGHMAKFVRSMRGACIACTEWEVCFFYEGTVVLRDDSDTVDSGIPDRWSVPSWDEGFRKLVDLLMSDAECDLINAAERMDVLAHLHLKKR
jgi:hypothetical protein